MSEEQKANIKSLRMRDDDYLRISQFFKENNVTQADGIKILLDNYSKINEVNFYEVEVKAMKLEKENKVLESILKNKDKRIKEMQKQIFKLEEEKLQLEDKNNELEIRNKM